MRARRAGLAATEAGVLFKKAFLNIEPEVRGLGIAVVFIHVRHWKLINVAVAIQHLIERLTPIFRVGVEDLGRPDFIGGKALGKFDQLPQVGG